MIQLLESASAHLRESLGNEKCQRLRMRGKGYGGKSMTRSEIVPGLPIHLRFVCLRWWRKDFYWHWRLGGTSEKWTYSCNSYGLRKVGKNWKMAHHSIYQQFILSLCCHQYTKLIGWTRQGIYLFFVFIFFLAGCARGGGSEFINHTAAANPANESRGLP